ncbi:hypothetical protein CEP53_009941 [Fusarium sp. AF-6]|nr:hypothetical protein CEP53_009941 [Fusarium sp. AF-6]
MESCWQLQEELATWGELKRSINRAEGSDDPEDRALSVARLHCGKYESSLLEILEYLEQFRDAEDKKEMASIIVELLRQFKSGRRHRRQMQAWIGDINISYDRDLLEIRTRIQRLGAILKAQPEDHEANDFQSERASTVTDLTDVADDLTSICYERATDSVISITTGVSMTGDFQELTSEVGFMYDGDQRYPGQGIAADLTDGKSRPTKDECFSEAGSSSSFNTDHLDEGRDVLDQTQPEDDFDQYAVSNVVLKKFEPSTVKECKRVVAGSFGQVTHGGPEILTMDSEEWHKGVWERF